MSADITEQEMRRALGLDNKLLEPKKPKVEISQVARPKSLSPKLRVTISVRRGNAGPTESFTHDANTLSRFDAIEQAKAAARAKKLTYWALLDVESIE
ncbi:hypothetical protein [Pseudomonas amygdali]|uniref:hypothetical protein n=1 Tax=Pseudomonas amygdali TaxID=47877 RepID=UPI0006E6F778|nr:hypothetical protein [Pseudomonas amygdali]KPY55616.1 hypothetical protein ALO93_200317 [Pseudomonas amygdali pv. sesami]